MIGAEPICAGALMLDLYRPDGAAVVPTDLAAASLSPDVVWLDLQDPNPEEVAFAERALGLEMPSFQDLSEIEASSRLYVDNGALFMSAPLVYRRNAERPEPTPVGFVLSRTHLVTVRFRPLAPFATFAQSLGRSETSYAGSAGLFTGLVEAIIERWKQSRAISTRCRTDCSASRRLPAGVIGQRVSRPIFATRYNG
jgi:magnesium transporter